VIELDAAAVAMLKTWKARQAEERLAMGARLGPVSTNTVSRDVSPSCESSASRADLVVCPRPNSPPVGLGE
jgi:hypothetical protein